MRLIKSTCAFDNLGLLSLFLFEPRHEKTRFLLHLLIAGCDIGVQISVHSFVRPSVHQHLRRSLVFSTSVIAASLKPCIVIALDIPFKHAP